MPTKQRFRCTHKHTQLLDTQTFHYIHTHKNKIKINIWHLQHPDYISSRSTVKLKIEPECACGDIGFAGGDSGLWSGVLGALEPRPRGLDIAGPAVWGCWGTVDWGPLDPWPVFKINQRIKIHPLLKIWGADILRRKKKREVASHLNNTKSTVIEIIFCTF